MIGALFLFAAVILGWTPFAIERVELLQLTSDQSIDFNQARLRSVVPRDSVALLNPDAWWMLRGHCRVYSMMFASPDIDSIQFIVFSGNGSGVPGKAREDVEYTQNAIQAKFAMVSDNLPRNPVAIGRFRLTNSAYGFGQLVLERLAEATKKDGKPPAAPK